MRLKTKITVLTGWLFVGLILVLIPASLLSFRQFSIVTAEEHVRAVAEVVRVSLTEQMINGVISHRESFLDRLSEVKGLLGARLVRGPNVVEQFGPGLGRERGPDVIEARVLQDGVPYFATLDEEGGSIFRGTIPFIVQDRGNPNCHQCHKAANGAVLGAITITLSLSHLKRQALVTILVLTLLIIGFAILAALFFRGQVAPVALVARRVQEVVAKAKEGNFRTHVLCNTEDEMGEIARDLNWLMSYLQENLSNISQEVARLIQYDLQDNSNLLVTTIEMVDALVEVAQFKQAVEEDRTTREVYLRIARILTNQFGVKTFSIYEVSSSRNHMRPVVVDGDPDAPASWCDPQILFHADACRALRTSHRIDSFSDLSLCSMFCGQQENPDLGHICLPVMHSGMVGNVVQLVVEQKNGHLYELLVPFIQVYLRESAPVVEAKRLMDTLRETALRDPLTGLHNRRFLEEYIDTLVATAKRKGYRISVLMIDLDHFKKVNDTYGHDAGDAVLRAIARELAAQVRTSDLVIRYGGEEFMVVLQETAGTSGEHVSEKIRLAVAGLEIALPNVVLKKTLSIGVATYPTHSEEFWEVVKLADNALYQAKQEGRNRVVIQQKPVTVEGAATRPDAPRG
ncbi:MAG: diguanylate cyclase [Magnetococcales bacterium]|nr:diguanylate cyclase [Magnetococcales bacterium]